MKTILLALIAGVLTLNGCGGSSGGSSGGGGGEAPPACANHAALGAWISGPDTLTFSANCTGTSTMCASTFTFTNTSTGVTTVNVLTTNGAAGCLPLGATACAYAVAGGNLSFDCGSGAVVYTH